MSEQQTASHAKRMDLLAAMVQELRAKLARAEEERDKISAAARAFQEIAAPPKDHDKCRLCGGLVAHENNCAYAVAAQALRDALRAAKED